MKLIIGLGNPGSKYIRNRHNAGHMLAEFLISNSKFLKNFQVLKTNSFMNDSGKFVKKAVSSKQLAVSDLFVAHDDLDLKLGQYKIQFGVGPKVHNGISSIESALGGKDFWRIRIGIDNRTDSGQARMTGEEYVLQDFTDEELKILKQVYAKVREDIAKI